MKQQIDPTSGSTPSVMVMNAMAKACPDHLDITKFFRMDGDAKEIAVEVEMLVNGVPVPFVETISEAWQALDAGLDSSIREKAVELIKGTKLQALLYQLEMAEWAIEEEIKKVLPT